MMLGKMEVAVWHILEQGMASEEGKGECQKAPQRDGRSSGYTDKVCVWEEEIGLLYVLNEAISKRITTGGGASGDKSEASKQRIQ